MYCLLNSAFACRSTHEPQQQVPFQLEQFGLASQVVTFNEVRRIDALPAAVLAQFSEGLADPGHDFQQTDAIRGRHLPWRRLIVAGVSGRYCIVHYERGGIGLSSLVALFELSDSKANVRWVSNTNRMSNLQELKTTLESSKLQNQLGQTAW